MKIRTMYSILYHIVWPFFCLFHPFKAIGRENIPEGAAILCPNHTGLSDPLLVAFAMTCRHRPRVMAKVELLEVPVVGFLLRKAGIFAVERNKGDITAIKTAMKTLRDGEKLLMFPEGTRHKDGQMGEAKTGVAMLSARTGVAIVPIYVPARKRWFRPTPVVFGEAFTPVFSGRNGTNEEYEAVSADLMARIAKLKEQVQ